MFRKVFKYDMKAMSRIALLCIPAVFLLSTAAALLIRAMATEVLEQFFILEMLAGIAVSFSLIAVGCYPLAVVFFSIRRYYNHFFSDEGYLTFTLPVKRGTLLWSKTLAAFLMWILAVVVELAAFNLFVILLPDNMEMMDFYREIFAALGERTLLPSLILALAYCLIAFFGNIALIHFAVTQGHLLAKKHKILAAIGLWYGINFVKSSLIQGAGFFFLVGLLDSGDLIGSAAPESALIMTNVYLIVLCLMEAALFFLFYFWNHTLLKTKLALS